MKPKMSGLTALVAVAALAGVVARPAPGAENAPNSAFPIKRAELDSLIEERIRDVPTDPLVVPAGGHETVTLRLGL